VLIVGGNGQGKTNLLEAVYLLAIAKSYRTSIERDLVHWSAQKAAEAGGDAVTARAHWRCSQRVAGSGLTIPLRTILRPIVVS
jgi:recombinational DNA repair ATPase RecF